MRKSVQDIFLKNSFCASQKKESHRDFEKHEVSKMSKEFLFLSGYFFTDKE